MHLNNEHAIKRNFVKKLMSITIVALMLISSFTIFFVETAKAAGSPNIISVVPQSENVTIGDSFYTLINVTANWQINNVSIDSITFNYTSPGVINYNTTTMGNLFTGGYWWTPNNDTGVIHNSTGYAHNLSWMNFTGVNGSTYTVANISWDAMNVGNIQINLTGTTSNVTDNGVTSIQYANITVHPKGPATLTTTTYNDTQINLTFSQDTGIDKITIRSSTSSPPSTPDSGTFVYNGTGTSFEDQNLNNTNTTYYYKAWGWNETAGLYCMDIETMQSSASTMPLLNTTIKGYTNDSNGPMSGVSILADNQSQFGIVTQNTSNGSGYYEIVIFEGDINITFSKDGYESDFYNASFSGNTTYWYNATLSGGQQGPPGGGMPLSDYSSSVSPYYVTNGTQQQFNLSLVRMDGLDTLRLNNLTVSLSDNLNYAGNNGTSLGAPSEYTVANISNYIRWSGTDSDGFLYNSTENFWFDVTTNGSLGTAYLNVSAEDNSSEYSNFSITVFITRNFSFTGSVYDIDGNALQGATGIMTVQSFTGGPPITLGSFTDTTNATGHFNITNIPTTVEEQAGPGGQGSEDLFYRLSAAEYAPGTPYAINISASLPSIGYSELSFMLNNPEMYLKKAISFRVEIIGANYNWSTWQIENYSYKTFQVMAKDLALGFPVQENTTAALEQIFSVPANRNYSLSIFPDQSFPVSVRLTNITSTCDAAGDLNQTGVVVNYTAYNGTYLLNVTVNASSTEKYINGSFNGVSEISQMAVVAYVMEDQDMVFENWALPYNLGNQSGGPMDYYDTSTGEYNISLPATVASSYILLRAYALNASGIYYMDSYMVSASGGDLSVSNHDFTMTQMLQGINRSISSNNVSSQWNQTSIINTTAVQFVLYNSTGVQLSNENPFVEIKRELGGTEYMQMINGQNGQFNVSLKQGESIKKLTIFSQQYAPVAAPVSASVLSGSTNTSTFDCHSGTCNITMRSFGEFDPFNQSQDFSMDMYTSNASCNIPNPPDNYSLTGGSGMDEDNFSPFNAILKGNINMLIESGNISVYYINVDLLASGPPDASFTDSATTSSGGLEAAWQFGSQGPDIYDYVLIGIPFDEDLENKSIEVKIEKLYDAEFNVIWNSTAGDDITTIENDDNLSDYRDYLNTSYEVYLNGTGVLCDENDPLLQNGLGYKDNINHTIWIKIPHFSGVGPTLITVSNFTFSGEFPYNNSWNIALTQSTVNVTIQDDEGDTFNWTIEVLGGDSNSSNNDVNGSKVCNLTTPLAAGTNYTWWVNVTDGNNSASLPYSFITTYAPSQSGESPTNGATGFCQAPELYVSCSDGDSNDKMNATWWSNSSGDWAQFDSNTTGFDNNTNITQTNSNFSDADTTYWWSVNLTDGNGAWDNQTYSFSMNSVPSLSGISPTNGASSVDTNPTMSVTCTDSDSDTMTVTWYHNESSNWWEFASNSSINTGNSTEQSNSNFTNYSTTYWWSVNLTDGCNWTNSTYSFTTRSQYTPSAPTGLTATTYNRTQINLSWTNADINNTYIEWYTSETWSRDTGTLLYNGTATSTTHPDLTSGTTYYYQAWGYNVTDNAFSGSYVSANDTTSSNSAPSLSGMSPSNGSSDVDKNQNTVNLTISDLDGDLFNWSIDVSNGDSNSSNGESNGSKICSLSTPLTYGATITWWVNVTDGFDTVNESYSFTVRSQYVPSAPSAFSVAAYNRTQINLSWSNAGVNSTVVELYTSEIWEVGTGTEIHNGTGTSVSHSSLSMGTTYYYQAWSWNMTDLVFSTTNVSVNQTTASNNAPGKTGIAPSNGSLYEELYPACNVTVSDAEGDLMEVRFYELNSTGVWILQQTNSSVTNTSLSWSNYSNASSYNTNYNWSVNISDGFNWTNSTYTFTTRNQSLPLTPSGFSASASGSTVTLSWTIGTRADKTRIQRKTGGYPADISDGSSVVNTTSSSASETLSDGTYYYRAWSWNDTGDLWSVSYASDSVTVSTSSTPSTPPQTTTYPVADAGGPYTETVGQTITFNGSDSTASTATATITGYKWDFENDGTYDTEFLTSATATHSYSTAGTYTVKLMVQESTTKTGSATTTVTITEAPVTDDEPAISSVTHSPATITGEDNVTISATITDDLGISTATCYWNDGTEHSTAMTADGDTYSASIGQFTEGITVTYWIIAVDTGSQTVQSATKSFYVVVSASMGNVTEGETQEITSEELEGTENLDGIEFTPASDLTDVKITIEEYEEKPEDVTEEPGLNDITLIITDEETVEEVHIYAYLEINLTAEGETVDEEDISELKIKFKVKLAWLTGNGIEKESVVLMRYHDGGWQQLSTEYLEGIDDDTYAYYEAISDGTSTFAIVAGEIGTTESKSKPSDEGFPWIFAVLGAVIIVILIFAFFFKTGYLYIEKVPVEPEKVTKKKPVKKESSKKSVKKEPYKYGPKKNR